MLRLTAGLSLFFFAAITACETTGPDAATIIVDNRGNRKVTVYISKCSDDTWGSSRGSVGDHEEKPFKVDPGCWDMQAAWTSSCHSEQRGQELGPMEVYRFVVEDPGDFCD
ncbi:MAG TPA: hypothetical protein VI383_04240 [Gemmatimonadales bacterium]|nr:hypothetical protein [Gemmatimonadales bacterium]